MSRVSKWEVNASYGRLSTLNSMAGSLNNISEKINNFVVDSKDKLTGGGFDALRKKALFYVDAYKTLAKLCENTANNIKSVNNSMCNFMADDIFMDDSRVETLRRKISQISAMIENLQNEENFFDRIEIWQPYINYTAMYKDLVEECKKLEELQPTDNRLWSSLDSNISDITRIRNSVNEIKVTHIN